MRVYKFKQGENLSLDYLTDFINTHALKTNSYNIFLDNWVKVDSLIFDGVDRNLFYNGIPNKKLKRIKWVKIERSQMKSKVKMEGWKIFNQS